MSAGESSEGSVYHLELRQFPHNMCRFNVTEQELRETILVPWAQERWVEFGERKWSPHQATLTVLRGPRIPFGQLTMGRGWRTAQRDGEDVTEELLSGVRGELARGGGGGAPAAAGGSLLAGQVATGEPAATGQQAASGAEGFTRQPPLGEQRPLEDLAADSLGLELLGQLGGEAVPLCRAWELAAERNPDAAASAALGLAERAIQSLLRARLAELVRVVPGSGEAVPVVGDEATGLVRALVSWAGAEALDAVRLRRV